MFYDDLKLVTANSKRTWAHYKSGGWTEKVADSRNISLDGSFIVSMVIREKEHDQFMNSKDMGEYLNC